MLNKLLILTYSLPTQIEVAKDLLDTREVTIIGVLLFLISLLITGVVHLYKKGEKQSEARLEEQKEFTKELLSITKQTTDTVNQVNELFKISK